MTRDTLIGLLAQSHLAQAESLRNYLQNRGLSKITCEVLNATKFAHIAAADKLLEMTDIMLLPDK